MGILDDAIREHLELKRQHGGDPSEIDRLEREALGPVRRQPLDSPDQEPASAAEVDDRSIESQETGELGQSDDEVYDEEDYSDEAETGDWGEPFEDGFERPGSRASKGEPSAGKSEGEFTEPPPTPEPEGQRGLLRWRRSRRESVAPEDAPPTQAEPPERATGGEETVEYGVDDALAAEGRKPPMHRAGRASSGEEDVLEETPEFLQDAPEHDRLWFEQRPPRDFDFDD
jgi:hypothetical protein